MQNWLKLLSLRLSLSFDAIMQRRPLASTTNLALRSRSQPSAAWALTPTARSSSKMTSVTFTPCRTLAPLSWAWRSSMVSIASRSTWKVQGWGFPSNGSSKSGSSTNFQSGDRGPFQQVPGFGTNPASFSFGRKPMRSKTRLVDGTRDSPTWSLGWMSFSMIRARRPF